MAALVFLIFAAPRLASATVPSSPSPFSQPVFMPQEWCATGACAPVAAAPPSIGNLTSHGGPVLHSVSNYAVFWLPTGYHFDTPSQDHGYPNASDANYESLVGRYLGDLAETSYYSIVQQYTDRSGAPGMATAFSGSWVDTTPYPNSEGTKANPIQDGDIEAEVLKAMTANGWSSGNGVFFVFTGLGAVSCAGSGCSYNAYCAYHSAFQTLGGQIVVYANVPDPGNVDTGSCLTTSATGGPSPNSGAFADSAVNLVAHEGFESITDPIFNGWYYQDDTHELADECAWKFGTVFGDGSNIALNGHKYILQQMWSNKDGGCFIPQALSTLVVVPSYQVLGGGSGFAPPTFSYFASGALKNVSLSTVSQTLNADVGTAWSVTGTLGGSTASERWQVMGGTSGVVGAGGGFSFTYYHQYLVTFGYSVVGGGSGFSPPSLTLVQLGNRSTLSVSALAGKGAWVDAQSGYNSTAVLGGSGSSERWAASAPSGIVSASVSMSQEYYHQYLVSFSYSGGGGSTPPLLTYSSLGKSSSQPLGSQPAAEWTDAGSAYSATNPLAGSTTTQRWFSSAGSGTVSGGSLQVQLPYGLQYFVTVQGGTAQSGWYNASSRATVSTAGVYGRQSGSGVRVTGYQVDVGSVQQTGPTTGLVNASLTVDGPHTVSFLTVQQYQVSLDSGATSALQSITSPSAQGDRFWYDAGTRVTLALNGVWGRAAGSGQRLVSYTVDGGTPIQVATTGAVQAIQAVAISSPVPVTAATTTQYRLSVGGGSVSASRQPEIPGDAGWYDSGTSVQLSLFYAWNEAAGSRSSATGVAVDGAAAPFQRSGSGTFLVPVTMGGAHVVNVSQVGQYSLAISGGSGVAVQPKSPTGDQFFDTGSSVTVSSARVWGATASSRMSLLSYGLDGVNTTVGPSGDNGNFTVPPITAQGPHEVEFFSAAQYLVGLRFTDSTGSRVIVPDQLTIMTSSPNATFVVNGPEVWVDSGSNFQISRLVWEGVDVRPLGQPVVVASPKNVTLATRVYETSLKVSDYLRFPVSGATATIELANGTSVVRTTDGSGTASLGPIPLGRFNATISALGVSQRVTGDATVDGPGVGVTLAASFPDIGALLVLVVAVLSLLYAVRRSRR